MAKAQPTEFQEALPDLPAQAAPTSTLGFYTQASDTTGNMVVPDPRYGGLPILTGEDNQPIPLYDFLEALDGITDYAWLKAEFPALSFGQIAGAFAFLRKLAQFNIRGLDIDRLEEEFIEGDPAFQAEMERALADREATRVLTGE